MNAIHNLFHVTKTYLPLIFDDVKPTAAQYFNNGILQRCRRNFSV